jgi:cell division protein FtsN
MKTNPTTPTAARQHGGIILGVILGLLVGLGIALGVAIYIMKVPTTFNNKGVSRSATQDAQEAKKNKDWDPNAPLSGKPAAKPEVPATAPTDGASAAPATNPPAAQPAPPISPAPATSTPTTSAPTTPAPKAATPPPATTAPTAATVPKSAGTGNTDTEYFVQVAAYSNEAEAQAMRGKLALAGFEGRIVEREQSGRTVYRVRTGPFTQAVAEKTKANLEAAGFETVLIRSQK